MKISLTYQVCKKYSHSLWFIRFKPQPNADFFMLTGTYAPSPNSFETRIANIQWKNIMLAFTFQEIKRFYGKCAPEN